MGFGGQKLLKNNFKVLERQESAKSETLIFYIKSLRCKKKKLALTSIYISLEKYGWTIRKSLFA